MKGISVCLHVQVSTRGTEMLFNYILLHYFGGKSRGGGEYIKMGRDTAVNQYRNTRSHSRSLLKGSYEINVKTLQEWSFQNIKVMKGM